jgi:rhamnose utilization protein RhaD (predicted bifunctional aldolase and dehydrogenase)
MPGATENLWDSSKTEGLSELESLAYRSNLLGHDRAVANYGGGNTPTKAKERDHTGREVNVLWVKDSGSDLASIKANQFTGLKLDEVLPLEQRDERRGDGRLPRQLPAQARHASRLHRDAPARLRALPARGPHSPGCDQHVLLCARRRRVRSGVLRR